MNPIIKFLSHPLMMLVYYAVSGAIVEFYPLHEIQKVGVFLLVTLVYLPLIGASLMLHSPRKRG